MPHSDPTQGPGSDEPSYGPPGIAPTAPASSVAPSTTASSVAPSATASYVAPPAFAPLEQRGEPLAGPPSEGPTAVTRPGSTRPGSTRRAGRGISGRAALAVGAALALAVGALTLLLVRAPTRTTPRPLSLPPVAGGYHEQVDRESAYLSDLVRGRVARLTGRPAADWDGALVGVYARPGDDVPDVIFTGLDRDAANRGLFSPGPVRANLDRLLATASLIDVSDYPTGLAVPPIPTPAGFAAASVAVACGTSADGSVLACVWVDAAHLGVVLDVRASMDSTDLARLSLALRAAAER